MLFVVEPLLSHRRVHDRTPAEEESRLRILHWAHWVLLTLSLLTVLAAVAGSHGMVLVP
jgi:hypothetical protein